MRTIPITFKKLEVLDFDPQTDHYKIRMLLNDGTDKAMERYSKLEDPAGQLQEWLKELRNKLREKHSKLSLEDHPLANQTVFKYTQEEDVIIEKMTKFLMRIKEKVRSSKQSRESYWDMQMKVKNQKVEF